jgi:hypothetical protein
VTDLDDTVARASRLLGSGLRIAVIAREPSLAARIARRFEGHRPDVTWVAFPFAPSAEGEKPVPDDRLLGVHAALWVTAPPSPFGEEERQAVSGLAAVGLPEHRALVLCNAELIDRISDDPDRERAEVRARLDALAPEGFARLDEEALPAWLGGLPELPELSRSRRRDVEKLLLSHALHQVRAEQASEEAALAEVDNLLGREDAALADAIREGKRVAAHVLGAVQRHGETLRQELKDFVQRLVQDLPAQVSGVDDTDLVRRVLPAWLQHVVGSWMTDALARWRAAVLADLADLDVPAGDVARAELLVPALHPGPMRGEAAWGRRLALTAAIGGGAAMMLAGLVLPGAIALGGGLLWSNFGKDDAADRARLLDGALVAVRRLGDEADRLLGDQLAQIRADLDHLGEKRGQELESERAEARQRLAERAAFHRGRIQALAARAAALESRA